MKNVFASFLLVTALGAAEIPDMPAEYRADPKAVVAAANAATPARFPDADAVLMMELTKPGDYDSERELRVVKNKDGSLGKFWMKFEPRFMRFTPCDKPDHLKKQEYSEQMKKIAAERKQQKAAGISQVQFTELPDTGEELPF